MRITAQNAVAGFQTVGRVRPFVGDLQPPHRKPPVISALSGDRRDLDADRFREDIVLEPGVVLVRKRQVVTKGLDGERSRLRWE